MTKMERHYEMIGRLLAFLVSQGLARVVLQQSNARDILGGGDGRAMRDFVDVVLWMAAEKLIRIETYNDGADFAFNRVQLTSKGIGLIQAKPDDAPLLASIEETVANNTGNGLDVSTYVKIGALVGSLLGGFTKSIS